jgi:ApbE superfamily uncharacterized protein (UPF0280 family)
MAAIAKVTGAQVSRLSGGRVHLHHGPIDIVFRADGTAEAVARAEARAAGRFSGLLDELVRELPSLRCPVTEGHASSAGQNLEGQIARAMMAAVAPHTEKFVTPMAAVAGAVADAVVAAATGPGLRRIYANNGGDAALWLAPGEAMTVALGLTGDRATTRATDPVRGVATSGWRGRSHSLGIADAVTVLAGSAAAADVAATLIANAVDLPGSPAVTRVRACDLDPDSDLGERLVTREVGSLSQGQVRAALAAGTRVADAMRAGGLIHAAVLYLAGQHAVVGAILIEGANDGRIHAAQDGADRRGNPP